MKHIFNSMMVLFLVFAVSSIAGEGKKVDLKIKGMTCQGCVNKVQASLNNVDGVSKTKVDLKTNSATVSANENVTLASLHKAVTDAGFAVVKEDATQNSGACCDGADANCCGAKKDDKKDQI